jgi:hypothetical protein
MRHETAKKIQHGLLAGLVASIVINAVYAPKSWVAFIPLGWALAGFGWSLWCRRNAR